MDIMRGVTDRETSLKRNKSAEKTGRHRDRLSVKERETDRVSCGGSMCDSPSRVVFVSLLSVFLSLSHQLSVYSS